MLFLMATPVNPEDVPAEEKRNDDDDDDDEMR